MKSDPAVQKAMEDFVAANMAGTLNSIDIKNIGDEVERVLHRNGLVNGHPLTPTERQGIAISTAIQQLRDAAQLLHIMMGHTSITVLRHQCQQRAQQMNETAEALTKEFRL